jgi:hypothetical protein
MKCFIPCFEETIDFHHVTVTKIYIYDDVQLYQLEPALLANEPYHLKYIIDIPPTTTKTYSSRLGRSIIEDLMEHARAMPWGESTFSVKLVDDCIHLVPFPYVGRGDDTDAVLEDLVCVIDRAATPYKTHIVPPKVLKANKAIGEVGAGTPPLEEWAKPTPQKEAAPRQGLQGIIMNSLAKEPDYKLKSFIHYAERHGAQKALKLVALSDSWM